ncbi:MAG: HAD family phosphatase [Lachnospiraceae bacterium]|nr:HAD family phosphatase [Lachnospiraceae bacterium]
MNPSGKKLLCTDLDETLLSSDKSISEENLNAIFKMTENGHFFAFASGRPVQSCLPLAKEYGFTSISGFYIIAYNGALIYDCAKGETVFTLPLERKYLRLIFDMAAKEHIHCHTYDKEHVVSEYRTAMLEEYTRVIKMPPVVVDDVSAYLKTEPLKIICADLYDRSKLERFEEKIKPLVKGHLDSVFSNDRLLEYNACGASKGNAVLKLCDILGVKHENSIAAGDQANDISMLKCAGTGCAVNNAVDEVKAVADHITENDNNHGAVAEIINSFIL